MRGSVIALLKICREHTSRGNHDIAVAMRDEELCYSTSLKVPACSLVELDYGAVSEVRSADSREDE
jgi:hypothetical protein